jgi:hypothetical protein
LLLPSYRAGRELHLSDSLFHALALTAGFFGTLTLATVVLWREGILSEAFYWVFTTHADPKIFLDKAVLITAAFVAACLPLIIGLVMAIRNDRDLWKGREAERTGLLILTVASAIGVAAGGRFYPHYYIQLLPALALLSAPHFAYWWSATREPHPWWLRRPFVTAWLAGIVTTFSVAHWWGLSSRREPSGAAQYLQKHSAPDARVFVWGESAAKTYLEAQRRPACRYILTFPLTGHIFGGPNNTDTHERILPNAWSTLEQDFRNHPPSFIIDDQVTPDAAYPARNFPILTKLLSERYRPVIRSAEAVVYQVR